MFGVPVTLTFQGREKINTDIGAFCSLSVRGLVIIYIIYLATKMTTHELDTFKTTEHPSDFAEIGRVPISNLGFNMVVGFS